MKKEKSKRSIVMELEVGETAVFPFSVTNDGLIRSYASTASMLDRKLSVTRDREKGIITVERYA